MKKRYALLAVVVPLLMVFIAMKQPSSPLQACWDQQVKPLQSNYLAVEYSETLNELAHLFEPWQQTNYTGKGTVWIGASSFAKADTLRSGKRGYISKTEYTKETMLFQDYGDKELFAVTQQMQEEFVFQSARYSPALLIDYFLQKKAVPSKHNDKRYTVYQLEIRGTTVQLFIRKIDALVEKVTLLGNDPMFGDVLTTFTYKQYAKTGDVTYAQTIGITKMGGKIAEEVTITSAKRVEKADDLLAAPDGYRLKDENAAGTDTVKTVKYNEHIYFVELAQAEERSLIVEFRDFLLVAEAPLNSANGELIIAEARKIAPGKPIRYFVFGHYHPHYLGGVRPFVHKGATVLATAPDTAYVHYLTQAPHTLQPDSLQLQPKGLKTEIISEKMIITDGSYSMEIHHIGEKSAHTKDYLIYYFPSEKLLFEDDLGGIPATGAIPKAGQRQEGLYNSIVDLQLNVDTIVQGWPLGSYDRKTIFSFAELESSVNAK